jgi:flagellar biosynthesis protein FliQ
MSGELQLILQQALLVTGTVSGPLLAALLLAGLGIGILQAATQVNDPAVGFVPRVLVTLLVIWLAGGWMLQRLAVYFTSSVGQMVVK